MTRHHMMRAATAAAGILLLSFGGASGAMAQAILPQVTFDEIMGIDVQTRRWNPTAMGLGAIGGVIGYNVLAPTVIPASNALGGPLAGSIVADGAIAASRVYAISSAVAGAFIGQWLYEKVSTR